MTTTRNEFCWLDRLPEDVTRYLRDEFGVMKRNDGEWTCIGKLDRRSEDVCVIARQIGDHRKSMLEVSYRTRTSFLFVKDPRFLVSKMNEICDGADRPTNGKVIVHLYTTHSAHCGRVYILTRSFVFGNDIRGNVSLQPSEVKYKTQVMIVP